MRRKCTEITCPGLPLLGSLLKVGGFVGVSSLVGLDVICYHSVSVSLYDSNYLKGYLKIFKGGVILCDPRPI